MIHKLQFSNKNENKFIYFKAVSTCFSFIVSREIPRYTTTAFISLHSTTVSASGFLDKVMIG